MSPPCHINTITYNITVCTESESHIHTSIYVVDTTRRAHSTRQLQVHIHVISKPFQVGERQQQRKLAKLQTCAASLLQPTLESYSLIPLAVSAVTENGTPITLSLVDASCLSEAGPSPQSATPPERPDPTAQTLYRLDSYCVSDEFYHEIAQVRTESSLTCAHCTGCLISHMYTVHSLGDTQTPQIPPHQSSEKGFNTSIPLSNPFEGCYVHLREASTEVLSPLVSHSS